jgi:hypothetical protein
MLHVTPPSLLISYYPVIEGTGVPKMIKREIEMLRDLGYSPREILEMTDDEARQILDRAKSNEDVQPQIEMSRRRKQAA